MKQAAFGLAVVVFLAIVAALNGAQQQRYECSGLFVDNTLKTEGSLFFALETYRWWIFWAKSDANLKTEIPSVHFAYYPDIRKVGDLLQIYQDGRPQGFFSLLSKSLSIQTVAGVFEGSCREI
jgi:hypothetical protein